MQTLQTTNLIIGFGKAGKTLAADLAKHGQDVILVEASDQMYGGTCIIPLCSCWKASMALNCSSSFSLSGCLPKYLY